jgi:hypothetical protein
MHLVTDPIISEAKNIERIIKQTIFVCTYVSQNPSVSGEGPPSAAPVPVLWQLAWVWARKQERAPWRKTGGERGS